MKLPFVSRGQYELLLRVYEQTLAQRDAAFERIERLQDQMNDRVGYAPVSATVRNELKENEATLEKLIAQTFVEDASAGQLDESYLQMIDEAVAAGKVS